MSSAEDDGSVCGGGKILFSLVYPPPKYLQVSACPVFKMMVVLPHNLSQVFPLLLAKCSLCVRVLVWYERPNLLAIAMSSGFRVALLVDGRPLRTTERHGTTYALAAPGRAFEVAVSHTNNATYMARLEVDGVDAEPVRAAGGAHTAH